MVDYDKVAQVLASLNPTYDELVYIIGYVMPHAPEATAQAIKNVHDKRNT